MSDPNPSSSAPSVRLPNRRGSDTLASNKPPIWSINQSACTQPAPLWYVIVHTRPVNDLADFRVPVTTVYKAVLAFSTCFRIDVVVGKGEGHLSKDCTSEPKPKACFKCNEVGHLVRYIRLP